MTAELLTLAAVLLAALALLYVRGLAGRLDRLHLRLDAATSALDARLIHRASLAHELAMSGPLDPASAILLLDAATSAQAGVAGGSMVRDAAQSDLSAALRAVLDDPETFTVLQQDDEARELLVELAQAGEGVLLARRFANDAVQAALAVRRRWLVRTLHLAGHAPWPISREMDDAPPQSLAEITLRAT